jgi:TP901 family phage tail tape measure protein
MASSGALSFNIVFDSAIKGSGFLQASFKGIHTYAKAVEQIKLFKGVSFPKLNDQLHTTVNHLDRMHRSAVKFRSAMDSKSFDASPLKASLSEAKKDMTGIANQANRYKQSMGGVRNGAKRVKHTTHKAVRRGGAFAGGMVVGAFTGAVASIQPIRTAITFESDMADVKKATNVSDKDLAKLEQSIGKIVNSKQGSLLNASQIARIQTAGGKSGVKMKDLPQFTKDMTMASVAMDLDTGEASTAFTKMANRMDIPIGKISILTNAFTALENSGTNSAKNLINTTGRLSGVFRGLKFKAPQSAGLSDFLNTLYVSPELAATSFKILTDRFKKTDSKFGYYKRLQKEGVSGLKSIIQEIKSSMSDEDMIKTFGSQGASVISNMSTKLPELKKALETVTDAKTAMAVATEYGIKMSTTEAREIAVKNKILWESKELGNQLKGSYISFLEVIPKAISWTKSFYMENKEAIHTVGKWTGVLLGASVAIKTISVVASPFVGLLKGGYKFVSWVMKSKRVLGVLRTGLLFAGRAVLWLGRAFLMNPIGLAVTAIAGGAYLIYSNWSKVKTFFGNFWTNIKGYFNRGKQFLMMAWSWSPLGLISKNWGQITSYFKKLVVKIKAPFEGFFNWIGKKFAWIGSLVGKVKGWTSGALSTAKNFLGMGEPKDNTLKKREADIPKALKPHRPKSSFYDVAPEKKADFISLKDSLKVSTLAPINNENYVSTIKKPNYHKPQTTFNDVNTSYETTLANASPMQGLTQGKTVKVGIENINVKVETTDGKFDNEHFVAQVERAMREINYDNESTAYEETA